MGKKVCGNHAGKPKKNLKRTCYSCSNINHKKVKGYNDADNPKQKAEKFEGQVFKCSALLAQSLVTN